MLLGEIGAAQGLKGEVRLRSFTEEPAAIAAYGPLEDETGARDRDRGLRVTPKALIVRIKGVTTREGAEALTGTKLYVPRSRLPEREEEEWYHADLIGLAALDRDGVTIGTVVAIQNFGAGDLLEIAPASGGTDRAHALHPRDGAGDRRRGRTPHSRPPRRSARIADRHKRFTLSTNGLVQVSRSLAPCPRL